MNRHIVSYYWQMFLNCGGDLDDNGSARGSDAAIEWHSRYWLEAERCH